MNKFINNIFFASILVVFSFLAELIAIIFIESYHYEKSMFLSVQAKHICILFLMVSFLPKRIKQIFVIFYLSFVVFQLLYFKYFGTYIVPIAFLQIFSEPGEILLSFIDELPRILPIMVSAILLAVVTYITIFKLLAKQIKATIVPLLIIIGVFANDLVITNKYFNPKNGKLAHDTVRLLLPRTNLLLANNTYRSLLYLLVGIVPIKIFGNISTFPVLDKPKIINPKPKVNIVFILGETLRAQQLSVLGYKYKTTPLLENIDGLTARTIYSGATMTKSSFAAIFNRLEHPGVARQISNQKNCLFSLAKANGFKTFFITSQTKNEVELTDRLLCRDDINIYRNRQDLNQLRADKNQKKYKYGDDIAIVDYLKEIDLSQPNFIVLHQRGSHSPYKYQSQKGFKPFKSSYDNSVVYTDYILNTIYETVKSNSTLPFYVIFTSDHGELLHEHGLNGHGWFKKEVYTVPFLFFPTTRTFNKSYVDNVKSHFDVSNLLVNFMGYDTTVRSNQNKNIFINGSDIDALAGYLKVIIKDNKEVSVEKITK